MPVKIPYLIAVDDNPEMAALVADAAEIVGFESQWVASARDLLRLIKQRSPAVIVTDICMPDIDGIELLKALSELHCQAGIVLMSGYDGKFIPLAEGLMQPYGLHDLGRLDKPFRMEEVQGVLAEAMAWVRGRAEGEG